MPRKRQAVRSSSFTADPPSPLSDDEPTPVEETSEPIETPPAPVTADLAPPAAPTLPIVPLNVYLSATRDVKIDQMDGFRVWCSERTLGKMSIPKWKERWLEYLAQPT